LSRIAKQTPEPWVSGESGEVLLASRPEYPRSGKPTIISCQCQSEQSNKPKISDTIRRDAMPDELLHENLLGVIEVLGERYEDNKEAAV